MTPPGLSGAAHSTVRCAGRLLAARETPDRGRQGVRAGRWPTHSEFPVMIERDGDWYLAYCREIPGTNGQGRTKDAALASGAVQDAEIGSHWVRFALFRANCPAPDLAFWTLQADAAAREHTQ